MLIHGSAIECNLAHWSSCWGSVCRKPVLLLDNPTPIDVLVQSCVSEIIIESPLSACYLIDHINSNMYKSYKH